MAAAVIHAPALEATLDLARPRPMTCCECAGVGFADVARQLAVEGCPLGELLRRTGCAQTCTACLPDLKRYLDSSR